MTDDTHVQALVRQAIADPGATLPREDGETVPSWSARAVLATIEKHPVLELRPYYPTQDAYDAACRALTKHRKRADDAEAGRDLLRAELAKREALSGASLAELRDAIEAVIEDDHEDGETLAAVIVDRVVGSLAADAKRWHDTYQSEVNARDEFFGELLALLPGAEDEGMDAYDQIPRAIKALRADRDRARDAAKAHRAGEEILQANINVLAAEKEAAEAEVKRLDRAGRIERIWYRHRARMERKEHERADRLAAEVKQLREQVRVVRLVGEDEARRAAYEAMDAERRGQESRRAVENVTFADMRRDRDRARAIAVALEQQLAEIAKITGQIESATASATGNREERIEAAIERDGVWSSSRNPEIARVSMAIDIQTDIAKRLRRALAGGEGQC